MYCGTILLTFITYIRPTTTTTTMARSLMLGVGGGERRCGRTGHFSSNLVNVAVVAILIIGQVDTHNGHIMLTVYIRNNRDHLLIPRIQDGNNEQVYIYCQYLSTESERDLQYMCRRNVPTFKASADTYFIRGLNCVSRI